MKLLFPVATKKYFQAAHTEPETASHLARLKAHHRDSWAHSLRVGLLSADLGYQWGLSRGDLHLLTTGALLHDIGKVDVPQDALNKPGPLDPEELADMSSHPRKGFIALEGYPDIVRAIAVSHHEFKIGPYPRASGIRLRHDGISRFRPQQGVSTAAFLSELVAAADIFDALVSKRSYKPRLAPDEVRTVLLGQFTGSPAVAESVLSRLGD